MGCFGCLSCKKKKSSEDRDKPGDRPKDKKIPEDKSPPSESFWLFKKMWPLASPFASSRASVDFYEKPSLIVTPGFIELKKR